MPYKDKEKQRAFQNEWIKTRRAAWTKEHGPCISCGGTENLQVDHIDPAQKVSHRIWSLSRVKQEIELAKCQVLCYECHKRKTRWQRNERSFLRRSNMNVL